MLAVMDPVWQKIDAFPVEEIREKALKDKRLVESIFDVALAEYKKFMYLVAMFGGSMAMCSAEVDEVWHTHILFTKDYQVFCNKVFGQFVHHQPKTSVSSLSSDSVSNFVNAYKTTFGELHPIWKVVDPDPEGRCYLPPSRRMGPPSNPQCEMKCGEDSCKQKCDGECGMPE